MASLLVVDNNSTIRSMIYDLFADEHLCRVTTSAEAAIAYLTSGVYDVVITDVLMEGRSGLELLEYVRQHSPATPVIIITVIGNQNQEYVQGYLERGAFDCLLKPFRLEDLESSVARAIEHRRRLLEEPPKPSTSDGAETDEAERGS